MGVEEEEESQHDGGHKPKRLRDQSVDDARARVAVQTTRDVPRALYQA